MSNVSWRAWALAGDHTAGAEIIPPAATADMDLRKSRRFIDASRALDELIAGRLRKGRANNASALKKIVTPCSNAHFRFSLRLRLRSELHAILRYVPKN